MKAIKALLKPNTNMNWAQELLILIPRLACGFMLACMFGGDKFGVPWSLADTGLGLFEVVDWFPNDVEKFGGPFAMAPELFAWLGAASEAIGGMLLLLGLFTRPASFLIACTMLTAIFFQKWDQGLWGMLPALGFLWVSIYHMAFGSGRLSLDYWIHRYFEKRTTSNPSTPFSIKAILTSLFLLVCIIGQSQIVGTGNVVTVKEKLDNFNKVNIQLSSKVNIMYSDEAFIEITTQSNLMPYIKRRVKNGSLTIDQREWIESNEGYKVVIGSPLINQITLGSWSTVHYKNINQTELEIDAEVGKLILSGKVENLIIKTGQAKLNATDLIAEDARVKASGYANIFLNVVNSLDVKGLDEKANLTLAQEPKHVIGDKKEKRRESNEAYYANAEFIQFTIKNNSLNRVNFYVVGPKKDGTTFSYGFPMMPGTTRDKNWSVGTKVYRENIFGSRKFLREITEEDEGKVVPLFD